MKIAVQRKAHQVEEGFQEQPPGTSAKSVNSLTLPPLWNDSRAPRTGATGLVMAGLFSISRKGAFMGGGASKLADMKEGGHAFHT